MPWRRSGVRTLEQARIKRREDTGKRFRSAAGSPSFRFGILESERVAKRPG
jgi:hypothetical protein